MSSTSTSSDPDGRTSATPGTSTATAPSTTPRAPPQPDLLRRQRPGLAQGDRQQGRRRHGHQDHLGRPADWQPGPTGQLHLLPRAAEDRPACRVHLHLDRLRRPRSRATPGTSTATAPTTTRTRGRPRRGSCQIGTVDRPAPSDRLRTAAAATTTRTVTVDVATRPPTVTRVDRPTRPGCSASVRRSASTRRPPTRNETPVRPRRTPSWCSVRTAHSRLCRRVEVQRWTGDDDTVSSSCRRCPTGRTST